MNEFLSKIENFLFDIFGLILPGMIFILLIVLPAYFSGLHHMQGKVLQDSNFLSFLHFVSFTISDLSKYKPGYLLFSLLLSSYIMGHLLKVASIVLYETLSAVFDDIINPLVKKLFRLILNDIYADYAKIFHRQLNSTLVHQYLKKLGRLVTKHVLSVFQFRSESYVRDNDSIKDDTMDLINSRLGTSFPAAWYSLYKIGTVTLMQEGVKSLSNFFLSKYNLYRSLSLISIVSFFYYLAFFKVTASYIASDIHHFKGVILWFLLGLWYTFHYKYKRYWTLCRNDTLMSLYYFLNKEKLKDRVVTTTP